MEIGAGICVVLLNFLLPWGNPLIPTIGSSGAIFGILLAYAMLYPDRTILFSFLIPIKVKYFVLIIGAIAFMSSFQVNTGVSEFAHLGGLLFGYMFMKAPRVQFDPAAEVRGSIANGSSGGPRKSSRCISGNKGRAGSQGALAGLK